MNTAHLAAPAPATGSAAAQRPTRSDATLGVGRSLLIKKYPLELIDPDFFLSFAGSDVMGAPGDARGGGDMGVDGPELKHLAHGQLILTADCVKAERLHRGMRGYFSVLAVLVIIGVSDIPVLVVNGLRMCAVGKSHLNGSLRLMSSHKNKRKKRNQELTPIVPSRPEPPIYIHDQRLVLPPGSNLVLRQAIPFPIVPRWALYGS